MSKCITVPLISSALFNPWGARSQVGYTFKVMPSQASNASTFAFCLVPSRTQISHYANGASALRGSPSSVFSPIQWKPQNCHGSMFLVGEKFCECVRATNHISMTKWIPSKRESLSQHFADFLTTKLLVLPTRSLPALRQKKCTCIIGHAQFLESKRGWCL